jgi:ribulose 1,5-bisphosphate synthetase/thiazole synthase
MKRRDFITSSVLASGMLAFGGFEGQAMNPDKKPVAQVAKDGFVTEPAKQIPVLATTDVVVIGGGPSGTTAAIAASRAGAKTYLIERYNHLGGLWTGGLVLPLLSTHGADKSKNRIQVIHGIGGEMAEKLKKMGMSVHEINPVVDPEAAKYLMDEMTTEAGVNVIFHAWCVGAIMDGKQIRGVFIESKSGRQAILAKVVIDCTGDGDVFHWAGEQFDEIKYYIGLNHRLGNVDRINASAPGYKEMNIGEETALPGVHWCNMLGDKEQCATDVLNLSRLQKKYRKEIWESTEELRKTPGYEQVYLLDTASQIGVRNSRILNGMYKLTLEDTMTFKSFDDVIGISGSWVTTSYKGNNVTSNERPYWQIPYRSLIPKNIDNLIVAGRCFCYEKNLIEDARVIGTCMVTGQGAGAAAAIAVKTRELPRDIDRKKLHQTLLEQKVWFG